MIDSSEVNAWRVGRQLGVSSQVVIRWAAAGCPYRLHAGKIPVFRLREVRAWLQARRLRSN